MRVVPSKASRTSGGVPCGMLCRQRSENIHGGFAHLMERMVPSNAPRTSGGQLPAGNRPSGAPFALLQSTPPSGAAASCSGCPDFRAAAASWCSAATVSVTSTFCGAPAMAPPRWFRAASPFLVNQRRGLQTAHGETTLQLRVLCLSDQLTCSFA